MAFKDTVVDFSIDVIGMDKYEEKIAGVGALKTFLGDKLLNPAIGKIKSAVKNPNQGIKFPVIKKDLPTITNVRTVSISANEGVSEFYSITSSTIVANIEYIPAAHAGNEISLEDVIRRKLDQADIAMTRQAETLAVAALEAAKNQVDGSAGVPYPFIANTYLTQNDIKDDLLHTVESIFVKNDITLDNGLNAVGGVEMMPYVRKLQQSGIANAENKALSLAGIDIEISNEVAPGSGNQMAMFLMPKGTLGLVSFIENDAETRENLGNVEYYKTFLPKLGLEVGVYETKGANDASASEGVGFEHVAKYSLQLAVDIFFVVPYNSAVASISAPINKFAVTVA